MKNSPDRSQPILSVFDATDLMSRYTPSKHKIVVYCDQNPVATVLPAIDHYHSALFALVGTGCVGPFFKEEQQRRAIAHVLFGGNISMIDRCICKIEGKNRQ